MDKEKTIPVVVGVTAHRALREEDLPALESTVRAELKKLAERCPNSELVMLTSLAEGGDLLCADAAAELGIPIIAALPMELELYAKDFSRDALRRLEAHCAAARQVFVVPAVEQFDGGDERDFCFRQAGIYVAGHSHVLLALWDGGPGTPAACGTADAVDFALRGAYSPAGGMALRSSANETVIHVFTPRGERTGEAAGTVHLLGDAEAVGEILDRTDEFNRVASQGGDTKRTLLPERPEDDLLLARMERLYVSAAASARANAAVYRRVLVLLAVAATGLTLAFLLYDEAEAHWMIILCGAMLAAAWLIQRYAARLACHRRYLDYRALAECLRVQAFLRYAGSGVTAASLLSWTQQKESAWIMAALCALTAGPDPEKSREIRACWVEDQRDYHRSAAGRDRRSLATSERVVRTALVVSVVFYLSALFFEFLCGGLILAPRIHVADVEIYRTVLKIVLGGISAATLFISNYYGKLSLNRGLSDHVKMADFYEKMSVQLQMRGQTDELLTVLAREELIENGNWCSYQQDNTPDFSL